MKRYFKINTADEVFSLYIRCRDKYTCQRCGRYEEPPTQIITCSHFWGRGNSATRFDKENCVALCLGCHTLWESEKQGDYMDFMLKRLGKSGYEALKRKAHGTKKRVDAEAELYEWCFSELARMADEFHFLHSKLDNYSRTRKLKPWHTLIKSLTTR